MLGRHKCPSVGNLSYKLWFHHTQNLQLLKRMRPLDKNGFEDRWKIVKYKTVILNVTIYLFEKNHPFKKYLLSAGHYLGLIQWRMWRSPHDAYVFFTIDGLSLESYTRNWWQWFPLRLGLGAGVGSGRKTNPGTLFLLWNVDLCETYSPFKKKKKTNGTSYFQKKLKMLGVIMVLWLCPFLKRDALWGIWSWNVMSV